MENVLHVKPFFKIAMKYATMSNGQLCSLLSQQQVNFLSRFASSGIEQASEVEKALLQTFDMLLA